MEYIIKKDFSYFFREKKRYLILILITLIMYPFAERFIYHFKSIPLEYWNDLKMSQLLLGNVGATYLNHGISSIAFYIPFALYTFLNFQTISCYFNHIKYGPESVFLRISKGRWLFCKYISIALYTIAFQFIVYIVLIIVYNFLGLQIDIANVTNIYLYDTIVKIYFGYIAIVLVSLFNNYGVPIMYGLILLAIINNRILELKPINVLYNLFAHTYIINGNVLYLLCMFIFLTVSTFIINRCTITRMFEREEFV